MIAYVKGPLAYVTDNCAVIDVCGLGVQVQASAATLARLPEAGAHTQLFTYLQLGESGQALHGFLTREEVRLFVLLIGVTGIGPKVATAILGTFPTEQIMLAVMARDAVMLSKAPGVGKKTAERIILELRDKVQAPDAWVLAGTYDTPGMGALATGAKQDAAEALLALGYSRTEVMQAMAPLTDDTLSAEALIKMALKKLNRS